MKLLDYVYYCVYRYFSKAPDRAAADAWSIAVLTWTLWIHGLIAYWVVELAASWAFPFPTKLIAGAAGIILAAIFYWYYAWKGNGARVVRSFEKCGCQAKYSRLGAALWWESLLILFIVVGLLILSQKLTGWPPHP